jgi:RimJ/RimL family protein N-acetyltransferase
VLQTARTYCAPVQTVHVPARFGWFNDPGVHAFVHMPSHPHALRANRKRSKIRPSAHGLSGLLELAGPTIDDHRYIGNIFFRKINWQDPNAEFGIFIGPRDLWSTGPGNGITKVMVDYDFARMGLHPFG